MGLNSTREGGVYVRKSDPKPDYVNKTPKAIPERAKLAYTEVFIDSITVIPLTWVYIVSTSLYTQILQVVLPV